MRNVNMAHRTSAQMKAFDKFGNLMSGGGVGELTGIFEGMKKPP